MNNEQLKEQIEKVQQDCQKIKQSLEAMMDSGAKEKTILVLMAHHTGLSQRVIKQVMNGLENLGDEYFGEED